MITEERKSPEGYPFKFYWRLKLVGSESDYWCVRGVVNYEYDDGSYDGIRAPYPSPYTALLRFPSRSAVFFNLNDPEQIFYNAKYLSNTELDYLRKFKDELLKDIALIKRIIENRYIDIPNYNSQFYLQLTNGDYL